MFSITAISCNPEPEPLEIPVNYTSANFESNTTFENGLHNELSQLATELNNAEAQAQKEPVSEINYPSNLSSITNPTYNDLIDQWLPELVKAANSNTAFQLPNANDPIENEEGGLLGNRLLDENGLELEQMVEKGAFAAALYNHAISLINAQEINTATIDQLVRIFGTNAEFDIETTSGPATYAKRRSNNTNGSGFFYNIKNSLITARTAIEAGEDYSEQKDEALNSFLLNWEKSNFATVINYCNATKLLIQEAASLSDSTQKIIKMGDAMHAYAEGVGFTHGFKGLITKQISDEKIDQILELLLAQVGQAPESYRFLNEAALLANFDQVIDIIQNEYGFTDEEVLGFYINN
jgi:hypothetical protein